MRLARPWSVLTAVALLAACGGGDGGPERAAPEAVALASDTASPANQNTLVVRGTTEPKLRVRVFAGAECAGTPLGEVTALADGAFSFSLEVADDSVTSLVAQAVAGAKAGACGPVLTYVEDSTAPGAPAGFATTPAAPSRDAAPRLTGAAEAGAEVSLFADAACAAPIATATATAAGFDAAIAVEAEGALALWARATDRAGNSSSCVAALTYVLDRTAPPAPVVAGTTPAADGPRRETAVTIDVDAEAGAAIAIHAGDACEAPLAATVLAAEGGRTRLAVVVPADATTLLAATATDAAGNVSPCSAAVAYVNDRTPPAPPALGLAAGARSPSPSLAARLAGTAEAGATVHVFTTPDCSGAEAATPATAVHGAFELDAAAAENALTAFRALAVDVAGNASACSAPVEYTNDTIAPAAPADLATAPASPANANAPRLGGTAEAGARVALWHEGTCAGEPVASARADGGVFELPFEVANDTDTPLFVAAIDPAGNVSACTGAGTYVEDSTPPGTPAVVATTPGNDRPRQEASVLVEVAAGPGAAVALFTDAACQAPIEATPVDGGGAGTFLLVTVPADAVTALHARATDAAGNVSGCSAGLAYENDQSPPPAPSLASAPPSPASEPSPRLSGDAEARATVRIHASAGCAEAPVATVVAGADGAFEAQVTVPLDATTSFWATATDVAGNAAGCPAVAQLVYRHDGTPPAPPAALALLPATVADDNVPALTGTAEEGSRVRLFAHAAGADPGPDPCAGAPAQQVVTGNTGDPASFVIVFPVADDTATDLWVQAVDAAGNPSACTPAGTYVEDSRAPDAPVLSTTAASPSQLATLEVTVAGEAGARVALYSGAGCAAPLPAAPVGGDDAVPAGGSIAFVATVASNATTAIGARLTDAAGNVSACSAPLLYTNDTLPPAPPSAGFSPASPSNRPDPAVTGTAEADARVDVYAGAGCSGAVVGTVARLSGAFSVPVAPAANAITAFSVRATDLAGNTAPGSCATISYRHDDVPPAAPALTRVDALDPATGIKGPYDGSFPTSDPGPLLTGNLPAVDARDVGVKIRVHAGDCSGAPLTQLDVTAANAPAPKTFGVTVPVPLDRVTVIAAQAVDDAGNPSACTTGVTYRHDGTPPAFAGLVEATATGTGTVRLEWNAAADAVSPEPRLVYEVCQSTSWDGCVASYTIQRTVTGSGLATYTATVTGLTGGTRYTFLVRVKDEAGNRDPNRAQHLARTYGDGVVAVASGAADPAAPAPRYTFTCALDAGGRIQCLRKAAGASPVTGNGGAGGPVFLGGAAVAVSAGEKHVCAVREDGAVFCWGENDAAQVSPVVGGSFSLPQQIFFEAGAPPAVGVDCGRNHSCALLADGTLRCWGANGAGQLGGGAASATAGPTKVANPPGVDGAPLSMVVAVAAGDRHTCALAADATAWCWGDKSSGQLGDGSARSGVSLAPVQFGATAPALTSVGIQAIDAGWSHTCALSTQANVWCAGAGGDGQLGQGDFASSSTPGQLTPATVRGIALGRAHSCAVLGNGTVRCWGDATFNQLGNWASGGSMPPDSAIPLNVAGAPDAWQGLFAGGDETCVVRAGKATCWGFGAFTGTNTTGAFLGGSPMLDQPVTGPSAATAVAAGRSHTCVLTGDGAVRCVGSNVLGQLGTGDAVGRAVALPVTMSVKGALVAGGDVTCAGGASGATCWGSNASGQIGDANPDHWAGGLVVGGTRLAPTSFARPAWPVAVADHACGAKGNGAVGAAECWGQNDRGQLGLGVDGAPTASGGNVVPSPLSVRGLAAGAQHACAVARNGEVDCWGDNTHGQLGDELRGTASASAGPIYDESATMRPAVEVDAGGGDTTCARTADGEVWCWGRNQLGQLGRGSASAAGSFAPAAVPGLLSPVALRAVDVAVGPRHVCAVIADGTVRCWGANEAGQLGDGTTTDRAAPVQVAGVAGARQVVVGDAHTCARLADGTARCWGANATGQLGDGSTTSRGVARTAEAIP